MEYTIKQPEIPMEDGVIDIEQIRPEHNHPEEGKKMDPFDVIRERLSQEELLAQLAEEAMELGHAALKLRRAYDGTNPTPVKRREAFENLKEEIADVRLLIDVLSLSRFWPEYDRIADKKLKRWAQRLEEVDHGE